MKSFFCSSVSANRGAPSGAARASARRPERSSMRYSILVLCLVLGLPAAALAEDDQPRLAFGSDAARSMTIAWNTQVDGQQFVEVRTQNAAWVRHEASRRAWEAMGRVIHEFPLVGLRPDTIYEYRVGDGQRWSEVHS